MALIIRTNTHAQQAMDNFKRNNRALMENMSSMSSGLRINRAADDAAGLAVSENLDAKALSARQASRNIQDGMSMMGTYETALNTIVDLAKRLREVTVQGASETVSAEGRKAIREEHSAILAEWTRVAKTVKFNGFDLADGEPTLSYYDSNRSHKKIDVQIGLGGGVNDKIEMDFLTLDPNKMGNESFYGSSGLTKMASVIWGGHWAAANSQNMLSGFEDIMTWFNMARSKIGATQSRLTASLNHLSNYSETTASARSQIRDADFASETAELSKRQVMQQASTAILVQANGVSEGALRLI